ncbi:MAG: hypothetical protein ABL921_34425, partial [Pirellula sp.]
MLSLILALAIQPQAAVMVNVGEQYKADWLFGGDINRETLIIAGAEPSSLSPDLPLFVGGMIDPNNEKRLVPAKPKEEELELHDRQVRFMVEAFENATSGKPNFNEFEKLVGEWKAAYFAAGTTEETEFPEIGVAIFKLFRDQISEADWKSQDDGTVYADYGTDALPGMLPLKVPDDFYSKIREMRTTFRELATNGGNEKANEYIYPPELQGDVQPKGGRIEIRGRATLAWAVISVYGENDKRIVGEQCLGAIRPFNAKIEPETSNFTIPWSSPSSAQMLQDNLVPNAPYVYSARLAEAHSSATGKPTVVVASPRLEAVFTKAHVDSEVNVKAAFSELAS